MTKDDFFILRNSITMLQVVQFYGFKIIRRGKSYFMECQFHNDKNASLQIFDGYKGFYCRGCGVAGDVTKFTQMYENVTPKEAGMLLSERFHIPISESSEIPEETRQRANEARLKRERVIARQLQIQTELREICAYLIAYNQLIVESKPFSDVWCYCQEELPKAIGKWEIVFAALEKK